MSRPVPSPSMKGTIGFEGTLSLPSTRVIGDAVVVISEFLLIRVIVLSVIFCLKLAKVCDPK